MITVIDTAPGINLYALEQPPVGTTVSYPWANLQDWRDMAPTHAGNCNVLFADGSIRSFKDLNKDGYLIPASPSRAPSRRRKWLRPATGPARWNCRRR